MDILPAPSNLPRCMTDKAFFVNVLKTYKVQCLNPNEEDILVPLKEFAASIEIVNPHRYVQGYTEEYKKYVNLDTPGGKQRKACLTRAGVVKFLSNTRRPAAGKLSQALGIHVAKHVPLETEFAINIKSAFASEHLLCQHQVDQYRLDLYFPDHKIALEFDEVAHKYTRAKDTERQHYIANKLQCQFVRAKQHDNIFDIISKLHDMMTSQGRLAQQLLVEKQQHISLLERQVNMMNNAQPPVQPDIMLFRSQAPPPAPNTEIELPPLPEFPAIQDLKSFHQAWQSIKPIYAQYEAKHTRFPWKKLFGEKSINMKQRKSRASNYLEFIDSLQPQLVPKILEEFEGFARKHHITSSAFVRDVFYGMNKPVKGLKHPKLSAELKVCMQEARLPTCSPYSTKVNAYKT